jgi:hypothetical protein
MMHKVLPLTALVLGLSGGAAFADRGDHRGDSHRGGDSHRSTVVVRDHGGNRGNVVVRDNGHRGGNVVVRDNGHRGGNVVVRDHGGYRGNTVVVRDHNGYRGGYRGGSRVIVRGDGRYYHNVSRRPIYVSRPVIRHRYFNYYQRPAVIFESYNSMPGYYWVPGAWTWDGAEWIWQPGHYQPDPNYIDASYGYDAGF